MTQSHTPGPWKVEHTFGEMIIRDSEDYPIATMTDEDTLPEAKANAELIASAPLLQDALDRAVLQSAVYLKEIKELKQRNKELRLKLSELKGLFSDNGEVVED